MGRFCDTQIRPHVDDLIKIIGQADFPLRFEELHNAILEQLDSLKDLTDKKLILDRLLEEHNIYFMKTMRILFIDRTPRKTHDQENKEIFYQIYSGYLKMIHPLWEHLQSGLEEYVKVGIETGNELDLKSFLKICRRIDAIYIGILIHGCQDMIYE